MDKLGLFVGTVHSEFPFDSLNPLPQWFNFLLSGHSRFHQIQYQSSQDRRKHALQPDPLEIVPVVTAQVGVDSEDPSRNGS